MSKLKGKIAVITGGSSSIGLATAKRFVEEFFIMGRRQAELDSRSIIESHGGRLWATSNEGPGATFQFILPIEVAAHQPA